MDERWHAITTEPCREALAQRHLTLQGFDAFYPMMIRRNVVRGRRFDVRCPLFPGYAFVEMCMGRHRDRVESQPGVSRVVGPLRPGAGEALKSLEPQQPAVVQVARLLVGMQVRIKLGPFTGHLARIARLHRERIKLVVALFNDDRETNWLPASWVEALSAEADAA